MATPPSTAAFPQLGRYQVINRIASGGMAEVFLARAVGAMGFQRRVALKLIHANFTRDPEFVKMFIDEARIAMHLHHRNIVQVFDLDQLQETYFIAMEYVHGVTVYDLYERCADQDRWIDVPLALYIVAEICKGLHFAHTRTGSGGQSLGIVHRDISPQNVLLSFEGEVKITDFGIATAAERLHQTAAGIVKGKYAYMAPERLEDRAVDGRVDVFAAGVLLYELLTGENPFAGPSAVETIENVIAADVPPPSSKGVPCPRRLDEIVHQALAKDPSDRFAHAQAFADALTEFAMNQTFARRDMASGDSALAGTLTSLFPERATPLGEGDPKELDLPGMPADEGSQDIDAPTVLRMSPVPGPSVEESSDTGQDLEAAGSSDSTVAVEPVSRARLSEEPLLGTEVDPDMDEATVASGAPGEDAYANTILSMPDGEDTEGGSTEFDGGPGQAPTAPTPQVSQPAAGRPDMPAAGTGAPDRSVGPRPGRVVREQVREPMASQPRVRVEPQPSMPTHPAPSAFPDPAVMPPHLQAGVPATPSSVQPPPRRVGNRVLLVLLVAAAAVAGAAAIRVVAQAGAAPALLSIRSQPTGADVQINGQLQSEPTPLLAQVSGGDAVILRLSKEGYETLQEQVRLQPGETVELNLSLVPRTGSVMVTPVPEAAEVLVDGTSKGTGSVLVQGLKLGEPIEVTVKAAGYRTKTRQVTLTLDEPRMSLVMDLARRRR
ncbi:MAG TPA: protein kinase [Myxococcales bacterium LLY-WYZ-16_1]|nr:protein kinase [Myxococcales bacterium LLY-WYZ-16_1]